MAHELMHFINTADMRTWVMSCLLNPVHTGWVL